jgi:predicted ATPase
MSLACPCCKAANDVGPNCRRCKADLSLAFAFEAHVASLKVAACSALLRRDFAAAWHIYQQVKTVLPTG